MHVFDEVVMTHKRIPKDWVIKRSTPLLTHHNTAAGVFGQLCVMEGTVTYYGFTDENATEPEIKVVINAGAFATSPPQYWHRVELSDDAQFNINFWVAPDFSGEKVYSTKK